MQNLLRNFFFLLLLVLRPGFADESMGCKKSLKFLHLTFHQGCSKEIAAVVKLLGHDVTTWFIPELPPQWFDGISQGSALYNMGHDRAERVWNLHKDQFQEFDAIITSDTASLSRIFLQNGFTKPLIIWICNRFDYRDSASLDCDFPDQEFYRLFNGAHLKDNVFMVAYTSFEHHYAKKKGIETGDLIITPCAPALDLTLSTSSIPVHVPKEKTFFIPPYLNETHFTDLPKQCADLGIPNYCGHYNGPADLKDFKGIICIPYAWSNLAFFENIAIGLPYFVPSQAFLRKLQKQGRSWFQDSYEKCFDLAEWYQPGREEIIIYFDSWEDLQHKVQITDYPSLKERIKQYTKQYQLTMLQRWSEIFEKIIRMP